MVRAKVLCASNFGEELHMGVIVGGAHIVEGVWSYSVYRALDSLSSGNIRPFPRKFQQGPWKHRALRI